MNPFGIDFGTTNSVLAQWNGTAVEVLPIDSPPVSRRKRSSSDALPDAVCSRSSAMVP